MRRLPHVSLILGIVVFMAADDADQPILESGQYDFRLLMPTQAIEGNRDRTRAAKVKADKNKLTIDTVDGVGKPLTLRGLSSAKAVKFGITKAEGDSLISLHFVGKATSNTSAEGTITIFVDGLKRADGKWTLSKKAPEGKR